ncbi:hypothetical protein D4764_07G0004350 [Takifugu flavidus]|uniref:Uncharacterized protein n=1 Tax=Takifugu flavidus TaxID=433684 RepID=A0A5C6MRI1_9TELE|nr:hypothetical protein D4764_07G0004350 [Takifugu flavidus]
MPILHSALAMEEENYLHPEGPQLDSSLFSVASSNLEEVLSSAVETMELLKCSVLLCSNRIIHCGCPSVTPGGCGEGVCY